MLFFLIGCHHDVTIEPSVAERTRIVVSLNDTRSKVSLGDRSDTGVYPIYWSEGDKIVVNGLLSEAAVIDSDNPSNAEFSINTSLTYPLYITYPCLSVTTGDVPKIVFPSEQVYVENSVDGKSIAMCSYVENGGENISLRHLSTVLRFSVKAGASEVELKRIVVTSEHGRLSGEFEVDCKMATLIPGNDASDQVTYNLPEGFKLSTTQESVFYVSIPSGNIGTCCMKFIDADGAGMITYWKPDSPVEAGIIRRFSTVVYRPGNGADLVELKREEGEWDDAVACGYVRDSNGNPIEGVVVSDGLLCSKTDAEGYYEICSDLSNKRFIMASVPSGYNAPVNDNGLPQFYYRISDSERHINRCAANFVFEQVDGNPDKYVMMIGADPQPMSRSNLYDHLAYHALDMCDDLYKDMRETATAKNSNEVYGLMLGDIVHEDMSLFNDYISGVSSIDCRMFNVIGNHDHDKNAPDDVAGARCFEDYFGPTYYSFNVGRQHYVVLDNIIMQMNDNKGLLTSYSYGLSDEIWQWLQNDLQYVDHSTVLMVASHAPMFMRQNGIEASASAKHGNEYAELLAKYSKVHSWAGHIHQTYNYNYPETSPYRNIESHTLVRSTGDWQTNDYLYGGTPRGYTVVEVDGDNISWYFQPTRYQSEWIGDNYSHTSGMPDYRYRDWNYDAEGLAIIGGKPLDSSYQIKAYPPGLYEVGYLYANVFLWDDKWNVPTFNGQPMSKVKVSESYDYAWKYLRDWYIENCAYWNEDQSVASGYLSTLFKIAVPSTVTSGIVAVIDRFGCEYLSEISW